MTSDPRKFVRQWLMENSITINERGTLQSFDNRDNTEIFDSLFLDYNERLSAYNYKAQKKLRPVPETHLKKAFTELISLHVADERKKIFERIRFQGAWVYEWDPIVQFVKAVTGQTEPQVVAVLQHYLWAVKRRMIDKEVVYHMMPILLGKQQGGKSEAIQKLLSPISSLAQRLSLPAVIDSRVQLSFSRTFAVIIDEMAGANKTDVDALKNLITASELDIRKLHTNDVLKIKQNVNLIGTTNRPVAEIIYDTTGARRFYEIQTLDLLDWATINSIAYFKLWQGIDETKERGYYEAQQSAITKDQESLIGLEELQVFLDIHNVRPGI